MCDAVTSTSMCAWTCRDRWHRRCSTTVYRVVQEGLTNIVRHSDAHRAQVAVSRDVGGGIVVLITDDGCPRPPLVEGAGAGLRGLRDRVALLNGTLRSGRGPDGWTLEARIPEAPS